MANPPWYETKVYRDPAFRFAEIHRARRENLLNWRRFRIRDPFACLGASFAIAGAAAVSRTTMYSLDRALYMLEEP